MKPNKLSSNLKTKMLKYNTSGNVSQLTEIKDFSQHLMAHQSTYWSSFSNHLNLKVILVISSDL